MKQTSFIVKNLEGNLPKKQSTIVKRSFRSSTKLLSLDSTIPVNELTTEIFYRFRTFKLFNIWTPPFLLHGSQYVTNSPTWRRLLAANFFTSSTNEDQETLGYKTLRRKNAVASFRENKASITFYICSLCIFLCDGL